MSYDKKLLEEKRKYGKVTCKVCRQRNITDWNIYKNNICSNECVMKLSVHRCAPLLSESYVYSTECPKFIRRIFHFVKHLITFRENSYTLLSGMV